MGLGKNKYLLLGLIICALALHVTAFDNTTSPSLMTLYGNYPTSEIYITESGELPDGSLTLNPNSTQEISCYGTAQDLDGTDNLFDVEAWLYSGSSVKEANDNTSIHYSNTSCDISTLDTNGFWNCSFDVYFFAENTTWICGANVTDDDGFVNSTVNTSVLMEDLLSIDVANATVDFGTLAVDNSYDSDLEVLVYNTGNVELDLRLDAWESNASVGFEHLSDYSFNCSIGQIPITNLRAHLTSGTQYSSSLSMLGAPQGSLIDLDLNKQIGGQGLNPTYRSTYWGIGLPYGIAGTCTGRIRYIAEAGN